jgi:hypothetical protein
VDLLKQLVSGLDTDDVRKLPDGCCCENVDSFWNGEEILGVD